MLIRLILLIAMVGGAWFAFVWWRRNQLLAQVSGGDSVAALGMREFEGLRRLAESHAGLRRALELRVNIVAAAKSDDDKRRLGGQVDSALRRLGDQVVLKKKIDQALESIDRARLAREAAGAKQQAATAEPDDSVHELVRQLELQLQQYDRLLERRKALDTAADRIVLLLGNLNLALLDTASSEATDDSDQVQSVLVSLDEAGENLRRTTNAQEEVAQLLKSSQSASA